MMSEKRFTLHLPIDEKDGTMGYIVDHCNKTTYFIRGETARKDLVNLLNDLNDKNEQLRQQLVDVTKSIDSLCNRVDKSNRSNEFKWGAIMGLRTLQRELKGDGV